jgi:hypothetical protein
MIPFWKSIHEIILSRWLKTSCGYLHFFSLLWIFAVFVTGREWETGKLYSQVTNQFNKGKERSQCRLRTTKRSLVISANCQSGQKSEETRKEILEQNKKLAKCSSKLFWGKGEHQTLEINTQSPDNKEAKSTRQSHASTDLKDCSHRPLYSESCDIATRQNCTPVGSCNSTLEWYVTTKRTLRLVHWCKEKQEVLCFSTDLFLQHKPCYP